MEIVPTRETAILSVFFLILQLGIVAVFLGVIWGFFSIVRSTRNIEQAQVHMLDRLRSIESTLESRTERVSDD